MPRWLGRVAVGATACLLACDFDADRTVDGVVETELISRNAYTVGDWPGVTGGSFIVRAWPDERASGDNLCAGAVVDAQDQWRCGLGPFSGMVSIADARIADRNVPELSILVPIEQFSSVEAYVSPYGHLQSAYALFLMQADGLSLPDALDAAAVELRPLVLEASLATSPSTPDARLGTDSERHGVVLAALSRAAARYSGLPTFHRTRTLVAALANTVRQTGRLQDVQIGQATGDVTARAELFRHELARELLGLAAEREWPVDSAERWANQINNQTGRLFGFDRAPPLQGGRSDDD